MLIKQQEFRNFIGLEAKFIIGLILKNKSLGQKA